MIDMSGTQMSLIFTDGNVDDLMAMYVLLSSGYPIPCAIIVDEGICPMDMAIKHVRALLHMMSIIVPIYKGSYSNREAPSEWQAGCHRLSKEIPWIRDYISSDRPDRRSGNPRTYIASPDIFTEPMDAIAMGPLTTVATFLRAGKISSLSMFAGGSVTEPGDKAEGVDMEFNAWIDPGAYEYVLSREDIPMTIWTTDDITGNLVSIARMMVMGSGFLRPLISMDVINEFRFWDLIMVMDILGYV